MGITKVALPQYAFGGLGMIPGTTVYVYFGTTISNISDAASGKFKGGILQLLLLIIGSLFAIVAVFYVSWVARKEVKKVLAKAEEEKKEKEIAENGGIEEEIQDSDKVDPDDSKIDNIDENQERVESIA